jgi:hypothetical protein
MLPSLIPPFQFLGVYVPNCGGKGGFDRRRAWDDDMKRFVSCSRSKPLILCGDLNVAPQWNDVSHPKWFRHVPASTTPLLPFNPSSKFNFSGNAIAPKLPTLATVVNQALRQTSSNHTTLASLLPCAPITPGLGFTPNEQSRFADIVAAGGLFDAFRSLHPSAPWEECVLLLLSC